MCVIMTIDEVYGFLAFLMPLAATFNAPYVWLELLIILLFKRRTLRVTTLIMWVVVVSHEIFPHFLYGISNGNRMIGYLVTVVFLLYLINDSDEEIDYNQCLNRFVLGVSVLFALYIFNIYIEKGASFVGQLILGSIRFGGTAADTFSTLAIQLNANTIAYYSIAAIACVFTLYCSEVNRKKKVLYGVAFVECSFVGALTISRSWFLVAAICIFMYVLACNSNPVRFIKRSAIVVGVAIIAFYFLSTRTTILDSFYLRFHSANIETAGGRTTITSQYLNLFWDNTTFFFLGSGVTDYTVVMKQGMSLHMGIIQVLCCMGVIVAPVFIGNLVSPLVRAFRDRVRLVYWIPIIVVIAFTQTIQFLNPYMLMLPYAIGVYALRMGAEAKDWVE